MKQKLLLILFGILMIKGSFAQNPTWIMPPYYNNNGGTTTLLPMPTSGNSSTDPYDGYDRQPAKFASNIIKGLNGGILFFIVDQFIYDKDGHLIDYIENWNEGISDITGTAEIAVIPDPSNCNRYYIVSSHVTPGIYLKLPYIALLNMSLPNINDATRFGALELFSGDKSKAITSFVPSFYPPDPSPGKRSAVFIAASKLRSDNSRFVFISNGDNIFRFKITSAGFAYDSYTIPLGSSAFNPYSLRGEMELLETSTGYKIACPYQPYNMYVGTNNVRTAVYTANLDLAGNLISGTVYRLPLMYSNTGGIENSAFLKGVEFSTNGNILYLTHTTNALQPNPIEYFDFNAPTAGTNGLQTLNVLNAINYQHSQIEMGLNDNLYFAHAGGLAKLPLSNTPNGSSFIANAVTFSYSPTYETSVLNPNPANYKSLTSYMLEDQIDGMDYNSFFLASNVPTPVIIGGTNFCSSSPITFSSSLSGAGIVGSYIWEVLTSAGYLYPGSVIVNGSNPGSFTVPSTLLCDRNYIVRLTVYNSCGNSKTISKSFRKYCLTKINAGLDQTICSGSSASLTFTSSTWPVTIFQSGVAFSIGNTMTSPFSVTPAVTSTYTLTNVANGACPGVSDQVVVTVLNPNPAFTPTLSIQTNQCYFSASSIYSNLLNTWVLYSCDINGGNEIQLESQSTLSVLSVVFATHPSAASGLYYKIRHYAGTKTCTKNASYVLSGWLSGRLMQIISESKDEDAKIEEVASINIYPNPTTGNFNIEFKEAEVQKVTVFDALGNIISESNVPDNSSKININLDEYSSGIYFVKINAGEKMIMKKLIKN